MTADAKMLIDKLFTKSKHDETSNTYRITLLKNFSHSNKVSKIRKNLKTFDVINEVFVAVQPVLSALQLSVEAIKHYATSVDKIEVFELARKKDEER